MEHQTFKPSHEKSYRSECDIDLGRVEHRVDVFIIQINKHIENEHSEKIAINYNLISIKCHI